ncbi:MAG: hypothetical protein AABX00_05735 [Nanoarchaeota archaeon]
MNRELERRIEEAWQSLSPQLRADVQREVGFNREDVSAEQLREIVLGYVGPKLMMVKSERLVREEADRIRREVQDEVRSTLGDMQSQYSAFLTHVSSIMENLVALKQMEATRPTQIAANPVPEQKYFPPSLSYTNCIRHHDPTSEHPKGEPGPERCVLTIPQEDGIHMRCLVAYASQNPGDQGFARLPYQVFHAELLRQGGCPRPLSRSISRRLPVISYLFTKPDICPLAGGEEMIVGHK